MNYKLPNTNRRKLSALLTLRLLLGKEFGIIGWFSLFMVIGVCLKYYNDRALFETKVLPFSVFVGISLFLVIKNLVKFYSVYNILNYGKPITVEQPEVSPTWLYLKNKRYYEIKANYNVKGKEYQLKEKTLKPDDFGDSQNYTVLYLWNKPEQALFVDNLCSEITETKPGSIDLLKVKSKVIIPVIYILLMATTLYLMQPNG